MIVLQVGKNVDKWLGLLSGKQVFPFGMGDENVANSKHGGKDILLIVPRVNWGSMTDEPGMIYICLTATTTHNNGYNNTYNKRTEFHNLQGFF